MRKNLLIKSAVALALAAPLLASAESQFVVGTGSASARLDFRVVIPRVLFLGVGTGAAAVTTTPGKRDTLTFDYSGNPTDVGGGASAVANSITNDGPNGTGSTFPVRVFGNNGTITLAAAGTDLVSTTLATDTIPITEITGTSSQTTALPIPAPGGSVNLPAGRVTNESANWTFAYANSAIRAAGTYNGNIVYTASMP